MTRILEDLKKFNVFSYDIKETTNIKYISKREQLYDDLISEDYAYYICREIIDKKYIEDMFDHKKIKGIILLNKQTDCIVAFMLFTRHKYHLSLKLLGTIEDEDERMGVRLGTLLLNILEKYAMEKRIYKIKTDVVKEAYEFYLKCGYKELNKRAGMHYMEKNLKEEIDKIVNLFDNNKEEEYDTESTDEDKYCEVDLEEEDSDMETEIGDEDYIMKDTYEKEMFEDDTIPYELCTIS